RGIDRLFGDIGNDTLEGGADADIVDGGGGQDTAQYQTSNAAVEIALFNGTALGGHATGDTLVDIENVVGSQLDDTIDGDARGNVLQGRGGDDILNGGRGNDALGGELGDDTLEGGAGADRLFGGLGSDTAQYLSSSTGVTVALFNGTASGGHADGDQFFSIENVSGSNRADRLSGDAGANTLRGGRGNDTLQGGSGDDALGGELGADRINAGSGDDRVFGGGGGDRFDFVLGNDLDTIFDFENNIDTLAIDRALVGNRTAQQVVDDFAEIVGGAAVFAFNASDVLEVRGIANVDALVDDIAFL
ncbi:MAG: calcium-binding protein, partial [Pseudomonadota bacterium]